MTKSILRYIFIFVFTFATLSGQWCAHGQDCKLVIEIPTLKNDDAAEEVNGIYNSSSMTALRDMKNQQVNVSDFPMECTTAKVLAAVVVPPGKILVFNVTHTKGVDTLFNSNQDNKEGFVINSRTHQEKNSTFIFGDNPDGSTINILRNANGLIIGSIIDVAQGIVIQIRVNSEGINFVDITLSSDFPPEADPFHDSVIVATESANTGTRNLLRSNLLKTSHDRSVPLARRGTAQNIILDVMVLWTKKAECANAGFPSGGCIVNSVTNEKMVDLIHLAVEETNAAYQQSGATMQLDLVHTYRSDFLEPSSDAFSTSLSSLRDQNDGNMDEVHTLREIYGADIVALIIDDPEYCGIGYLGPRIDLMFSVTNWDCATGYFSFGHEIGHNMGLHHDRGTVNNCNYNDGTYNYGYRDPAGDFRTIMAYNCRTDECDRNQSNGCIRVQRFSTPDMSIGNKVLGAYFANSVRWLNDIGMEVANYFSRPSSNPSLEPTSTPTQKPSSMKPTLHPTSAPLYISTTQEPSIDNQPSSKEPTTFQPINPPPSSQPSPGYTSSQSPTLHCTDNPLFTFILDNGNVQNCEWLTKNDLRTKTRIAKYCPRGHVKGSCQKSCDFCPCVDDALFTFTLNNGNVRGCTWFIRNEDRIDVRQERYCYLEDGLSASSVGDACVSSCGFCTTS